MRRISLASRRGRGKRAALLDSAQAMRYATKGRSKSMRKAVPTQNRIMIVRVESVDGLKGVIMFLLLF